MSAAKAVAPVVADLISELKQNRLAVSFTIETRTWKAKDGSTGTATDIKPYYRGFPLAATQLGGTMYAGLVKKPTWKEGILNVAFAPEQSPEMKELDDLMAESLHMQHADKLKLVLKNPGAKLVADFAQFRQHVYGDSIWTEGTEYENEKKETKKGLDSIKLLVKLNNSVPDLSEVSIVDRNGALIDTELLKKRKVIKYIFLPSYNLTKDRTKLRCSCSLQHLVVDYMATIKYTAGDETQYVAPALSAHQQATTTTTPPTTSSSPTFAAPPAHLVANPISSSLAEAASKLAASTAPPPTTTTKSGVPVVQTVLPPDIKAK